MTDLLRLTRLVYRFSSFWMLVALLAYPIADLRLSVRGASMPPHVPFLVAFYAAAIGQALFSGTVRGGVCMWITVPLFLALALLTGLHGAQVNAGQPTDVFKFAAYLPVLLAFPQGVRTRPDFRRLAVLFGVVTTCVMFYGYHQFLTKGAEGMSRYWGIRYLPSTRNSDVLYPIFAFLLTLAFCLFGVRCRGRRILVFLLVCLPAAAAVLLLQSRGGWLSALAGASVVLVLSIARFRDPGRQVVKWLRIVLVFGLVAGAYYLAMPEEQKDLLQHRAATFLELKNPEVSNSERLDTYVKTLRYIPSHPLGIGWDQFAVHAREMDLTSRTLEHAECAYLNVFLEAGIAGGLLFLAFMLYPLAKIPVLFRRAPAAQAPWEWYGFYALLVSVAVYNLLNVELQSFYYWVAVSIGSCLLNFVPRGAPAGAVGKEAVRDAA